MHIPLSEAEGRLLELVGRVELGDEVVLTRDGQPVARLEPVANERTSAALATEELRARRRAALERLRGCAKNKSGPDAAHSADFLYDEFGLPT